MKVEIETKHNFSISLYLLEEDTKALFNAVTNCLAKNSHVKLANGLTLYFYCNIHDINNPIYTVAVLSKGRRVFYGEYKYHNLVRDLNINISEYKRFHSTHYTGR